jgi:parvulin-like peptidyl-prolyl isomerase
MKNNLSLFLSIGLALSLGLVTACSQAPDTKKSESKETPTNSAGQTTGKEDNAHKVVNLNDYPNDTTICTIGGTPITVGDYKRFFKLQEIQILSAIDQNQETRTKLVEEAKKAGMSLSEDEKAKALDASKRSAGADFQKFLKDRKLTESEFAQQVYDVRLALKAADAMLSQNLLNNLVNRTILCNAGEAHGYGKKAMNEYIQIKHSPTYSELQRLTGFSADELKDVLVDNELSKAMAEQIQKRYRPNVTQAEIREAYNKNKQLFKHKERIRLSQIIIAAPESDQPGLQGIATQLKKANPSLSKEEVEKRVQLFMNTQKIKATEVLALALNGKNFAQLANENSDDKNVRANKTGGDMGFQQRDQLVKAFADVVWPLKPGQVVPKVIKTPIGFHIMKVTAHEGAGTMSLDEVRNFLKENIAANKKQHALESWLVEQRQKTKIALAPQFQSLLQANTPAGGTSTLPGTATSATPTPGVTAPGATTPDNSVSGLSSSVQH